MTDPTFQDVVMAIEAMAEAIQTHPTVAEFGPTGVELAWVAVQALDAAGYHISPAPPPVPAPVPTPSELAWQPATVTNMTARPGRVTLEGDTRPNQPDPDPAPTGDAA